MSTSYAGRARLMTTNVPLSACTRRRIDYELVNGLLRGTVNPDDLEEHDRTNLSRIIAGVRTAIAAGACQEVVVWRGVRNVAATFGVDHESAASLVGKVRVAAGFLSTTVFRSIAMSEFVGPKQGALLRLRVPADVKAAWLPPVGDPSLGYPAGSSTSMSARRSSRRGTATNSSKASCEPRKGWCARNERSHTPSKQLTESVSDINRPRSVGHQPESHTGSQWA